MDFLSDIGDFFSNGWDSFTSLFGESEPASDSYGGTLSNLDIDGDGNIGSMPISDYSPSGDYDYFGDFGNYEPGKNDFTGVTGGGGGGGSSSGSKSNSPWYTNPAVLSAAITSGAGLFKGMNELSLQKEALKKAEEDKKMNQMLELAKLKYQLLGKGGSSGRRSGGGSNRSADINAGYSRQQSNGYQALGQQLSNIYGG